LTKPVKSLEFDISGFEDLSWWIEKDRKKPSKLSNLLKKSGANAFHGTCKPEPLKHDLTGCWSRRIDRELRLVYQVKNDKIRILACRYHY